MSSRRGMTLVELMMVVAIIGSLASMAIPNFVDQARRAKRVEQTGVIAFIEQSAQQRLADESLAPGAYTAAWNPADVPSRFDRSMAGWREFEIDVDGLLRYAYKLDAIAAAQPTFTVTVREDVGGRLVYRTRDWQLCSVWTLLSDTRDGVALTPPLEPCSPLSSSGSAPSAGASGSSGSSGSGSSSSGSSSSGSSSGDSHGGDSPSDDSHGGDGHSGDSHSDDGHGGDSHGGEGESHGSEGDSHGGEGDSHGSEGDSHGT